MQSRQAAVKKKLLYYEKEKAPEFFGAFEMNRNFMFPAFLREALRD